MTPAGVSLLTSVYLGLLVGGIAFAWQWESGAPLRPFAPKRARVVQHQLTLGEPAEVGAGVAVGDEGGVNVCPSRMFCVAVAMAFSVIRSPTRRTKKSMFTAHHIVSNGWPS